MPEIALNDLRALIREEVTGRKARNPRNKTKRRLQIVFSVTAEERIAIESAADERGINISDLIRLCLSQTLQREFPTNRAVPPQLRPTTRRSPYTSIEQLAAIARRGVIASRMLANETDAAVGQTAAVPVPKLRGPQRPE